MKSLFFVPGNLAIARRVPTPFERLNGQIVTVLSGPMRWSDNRGQHFQGYKVTNHEIRRAFPHIGYAVLEDVSLAALVACEPLTDRQWDAIDRHIARLVLACRTPPRAR